MTVGNLIKAIAYLLESVGAPGQWTPQEYRAAMDKAALYAAIKLQLTPAFLPDSPALDPGAASWTITPAPLRILLVREAMTRRILLRSSEALENRMDPEWRDKAGIPTAWWPENGNTIQLNRMAPAAPTVVKLSVQVLEAPIPMGLDSDPVDPRFPVNVQQALRFLAGAYLLEQAGDRQDLQVADTLRAKFLAEIEGVSNA